MRVSWTVAWITGASSGIGAALAADLAGRGVTVAASARSADKLAALAGRCNGVAAFPLDVTDGDAVLQTVADIEASAGPIDLAILNAGIWQPFSARNFDAEAVRRAIEVNYLGVVHGLSALLPRMIGRGGGQIAIVASVAGYRGMPRAAAYAPSKAALISLAECLHPDLARHGVRISIVNPGFVDTPMTRVNEFPMPFIVPADYAAQRILSGLRRGAFEIAFPWQIVTLLKLLRVLPYRLFFWYLRTFMAGRR